MLARHDTQRGFTMIEMIVAIVVMSILAIGLVGYITNSTGGYVQTATRNQLSAAGRVVIDRIAMDLHNALPESIRISTPLGVIDAANGEGFAGDQCLEFIPVLAASTYLDPAVRPAAHKLYFDVVDFVPNQVGSTGAYAVIYPTSSAQLYAADFNGTGPNNRATEAIARVNVSDGVLMNTDRLTYSRLLDNAPYEHRFRRHSSVDRIFLTGQPISYCVSGNRLYRYTNYGFTAVQKAPLEPGNTCDAGPPVTSCFAAATPQRVLVTDQLDNSALTGGGAGQAFDQLVASRRRNAVIQIELNFSQDGEQVRLNHEVLQQTTQ